MKQLIKFFFNAFGVHLKAEPKTFVMVTTFIPQSELPCPKGVAVDTNGNVIFSYDFYRVCKVTSYGKPIMNIGEPLYVSLSGEEIRNDFKNPRSVSADEIGNIYVADTGNNRICKITSDGNVTTLAGSGISDYADGRGTDACFREPEGVALDTSGNIYVADTGNHRIRKITPDGNVTTLAGSGKIDCKDGPGKFACFYSPKGVAVSASGNIYVADTSNNRIRMITTSGNVSTLAGSGIFGYLDGRCREARFSFPSGVAVDVSGNVYVADTGSNRIRKITANGLSYITANSHVTTIAGSNKGLHLRSGYFDGIGTEASFNEPHAVAVHTCGDLYVTDSGNNRIRKVTNYYTSEVAVDASGNVFVADTYKNQMRLISPGSTSNKMI
jgi:serine/threonine-protein kinase